MNWLEFKLFLGKIYVYGFYKSILIKNFIRKLFLGVKESKYLFLISPPFSGSTMLNELLSSSTNVSSNNLRNTREGQQLPGVKRILWDSGKNWQEDAEFDWKYIKKVWRRYWDVTKPILLEKSPSNIVRTDVLVKHFSPSFFICLVRNPYALAEGFMRRSKVNHQPLDAANFIVKCFNYQYRNIKSIEHAIVLTYEETTSNHEKLIKKISDFIPELNDIDVHIETKAHNIRQRPNKIENLNFEKISKISEDDFQLINSVFKEHRELFEFFGYEIYDTLKETLKNS